MTDNQQYSQHEQARGRAERRHYKALRSAYTKAFEPILREYEASGVWRYELIDTQPITNAMNDLYYSTSKEAYSRVYTQIINDEQKRRKIELEQKAQEAKAYQARVSKYLGRYLASELVKFQNAIRKNYDAFSKAMNAGYVESVKDEINVNLTLDEQLADSYAQQMAAWLNTYAGEKIVSVRDTTRKGVRGIIQQAIAEGLSVENTARLIRRQYSQFSRLRATTIARTETVTAANQGSLGGANATNLNVKKFWIVQRDGRERDSHREAGDTYNRQNAIPLNDSFEVGTDTMSAPGAGSEAKENVNCRCTIGYVVDRR